MRTHTNNRIKLHRSHLGFTLIELMMAILIGMTIAAMAIPMLLSLAQNFRTGGDIRSLSSDVALAKMRAAADFTEARLYADLSAGTYRVETWNKTSGCWMAEGDRTCTSTPTQYTLSKKVTFGYGSLASPPNNTQSVLGQAPTCLDDTGTGSSSLIPGTACIVFNSRGIPIDSMTHAPYGDDAIYITDGSSVYGVTVSATALVKAWRTDANASSWTSY